jgi:hypothetical protein
MTLPLSGTIDDSHFAKLYFYATEEQSTPPRPDIAVTIHVGDRTIAKQCCHTKFLASDDCYVKYHVVRHLVEASPADPDFFNSLVQSGRVNRTARLAALSIS